MNQKPVFAVPARTVLNLNSKFKEKLLCDGPTFSAGSACAYSCQFCYVPAIMSRTPHTEALKPSHTAFEDAVIRRADAAEILRAQLLDGHGNPRYKNQDDARVVYASPLVDVAANMTLVKETIELCRIILNNTYWQIRLLSKSNLLPVIAEVLDRYRDRMIYGVSTGTLDDGLARAIETGTPLVSKRIESLHKLQDAGFRTFGMICPSLPQDDYETFSRQMCEAIRVDRCEHVWAEVINLRGRSMTRTVSALQRAGNNAEASYLAATGNRAVWEEYARGTFIAHTRYVPANKLRFLQYAHRDSLTWWAQYQHMGAVLL